MSRNFPLLLLVLSIEFSGCGRIRGTYNSEDYGVCGPTYSMKFSRGDSVLVTRHGWWDSTHVHDYLLTKDTLSIVLRDDRPDELIFLMTQHHTIKPLIVDKDSIPMRFWGLSQPYWKRKRVP